MKSEIALVATPTAPPRSFTVQLPSTRRSARRARTLAVSHLENWGFGRDTDTSQNFALLVAELCANAVQHGHVPGRDFLLRVTDSANTVRIEVSDASRDQPVALTPPPDSDSGRGLLLVTTLATRWGVTAREPIGKTVWAELTWAP